MFLKQKIPAAYSTTEICKTLTDVKIEDFTADIGGATRTPFPQPL